MMDICPISAVVDRVIRSAAAMACLIGIVGCDDGVGDSLADRRRNLTEHSFAGLRPAGAFLPSERATLRESGCVITRITTPMSAGPTLHTQLVDCENEPKQKTLIELQAAAAEARTLVFEIASDRSSNFANSVQFIDMNSDGFAEFVQMDWTCNEPSGQGCERGWIYRLNEQRDRYEMYFAFGHEHLWGNEHVLVTDTSYGAPESRYQLFVAELPEKMRRSHSAITWFGGLLYEVSFDPSTRACRAQFAENENEPLKVVEPVPSALARFCVEKLEP